MAQRITCTTNSSGHDGTYVYRSTATMDPQNLPAPIADEPPVAQGATFEYIDNDTLADGTYYYRVQDHEGGEVSAASDEFVLALGPDYASAQIGDEIGGGIYAGTILYGDGREYHLIVAKQSGEVTAAWRDTRTATPGTTDMDDGMANTLAMEAEGLSVHPAASHCLGYAGGGYEDWYLPARNEGVVLLNAFRGSGHAEFTNAESSPNYTWTSTEYDANAQKARVIRFNDTYTAEEEYYKDNGSFVRPVRRVPA